MVKNVAAMNIVNNKNTITWELQSETLKALRFPLVVMVVLIHSFCLKDYDLPSIESLLNMDINVAIQILLSHVISHIAVPTFYLISGYFFFYKVTHFDVTIYKGKLRKRVHTLLIPYLLWNALYVLWVVILKVGAFLVKGKPLSNIIVFFQENHWLGMFWDCNVWGFDRKSWLGCIPPHTGPILIPLWFLRDLMVVVILTPFIYYLIKRFKYWIIMLLCACYITGIWPYIHGFSITAIFFFSLGAYFSIHGKNMVSELYRYRLISYFLIIPMMLLMWYYDGNNSEIGQYIYPFYIITGVVSIVCLSTTLTSQGRMNLSKHFSGVTFFIYVSHGLIGFSIANIILNNIVPMHYTELIVKIGYYLLLPILTITICCLIFVLMERYCPKILDVLTGNRNKLSFYDRNKK